MSENHGRLVGAWPEETIHEKLWMKRQGALCEVAPSNCPYQKTCLSPCDAGFNAHDGRLSEDIVVGVLLPFDVYHAPPTLTSPSVNDGSVRLEESLSGLVIVCRWFHPGSKLCHFVGGVVKGCFDAVLCWWHCLWTSSAVKLSG